MRADTAGFSGDQREPHEGDAVSLITLAELGVIYKEIPVDDGGKWEKTLGEVSSSCSMRGEAEVTKTNLPKRKVIRTSVSHEVQTRNTYWFARTKWRLTTVPARPNYCDESWFGRFVRGENQDVFRRVCSPASL